MLNRWKKNRSRGSGAVSDDSIVPSSAAVAGRELGGRLAGLTLPQQVFWLSIWPFFEQILNLSVGLVDLALAGRLEPASARVSAIDALGVSVYVGWLIGMLFSTVGVGATALIARAVGGSHKRLANSGVGQAMVMSVVAGFIVGLLIFIMARPISLVIGLEQDAVDQAVDYLNIYAIAAPFSAVMMVGMACLRGAGDTRSPFFAMILINLVNIGMSYLLVFGPEPFGGHGVQGIAMGTACAWATGSLLVLIILMSGKAGIRLRLIRLRPHWHTMKRILRVGLPSLGEYGGMWSLNFLVLTFIGTLGAGAVGAHTIAIRLEAISFMPGFALGTAAATLAGQYLGLGDPHRARKAVSMCWGAGVVLMSCVGVVLFFFPEYLVRMISDAPEHLSMSPRLLMICAVIQPLFACYMILGHAMRGAGDTLTTMLLSFTSLILVRVGGAYVVVFVFDGGLVAIWFALCADLALKGILFTGRFLQGGWAKVEV